MAGAASAHQAATASREQNSQQRAGRTRRTSADPQRAQQGATPAAAAAPAALDSLSRLQQLADASPQVAQLRRLQALANARFAPVVQLAGDPVEEEHVQGKFSTAQLQPQLQQTPRANNTGLPDKLKSGIESLSGLSMDDVRVHYNSSQPAQLNALAYAQGSDIHLAPGQERHLPHEAWHVVQQAQGRVRPTIQLKSGASLNLDTTLEREADKMGGEALQMSSDLDVSLSILQRNEACHASAVPLHQGVGTASQNPLQLIVNRRFHSNYLRTGEAEEATGRDLSKESSLDLAAHSSARGRGAAYIINAIVSYRELGELPRVIAAMTNGLEEGDQQRIALVIGVNARSVDEHALENAIDGVAKLIEEYPFAIALVPLTFKGRAFPYGLMRNRVLHSEETREMTRYFTHLDLHPYISIQDFDTGSRRVGGADGQHIFHAIDGVLRPTTESEDRDDSLDEDEDLRGMDYLPLMIAGGYRAGDRQELHKRTRERLGKDGIEVDDNHLSGCIDEFVPEIERDMRYRQQYARLDPLLPYAPEPNLFLDATAVMAGSPHGCRLVFGEGGAEFTEMAKSVSRFAASELETHYLQRYQNAVEALEHQEAPSDNSVYRDAPEYWRNQLLIDSQNNRHPIRGSSVAVDYEGLNVETDLSRLAASAYSARTAQSHAGLATVADRFFNSKRDKKGAAPSKVRDDFSEKLKQVGSLSDLNPLDPRWKGEKFGMGKTMSEALSVPFSSSGPFSGMHYGIPPERKEAALRQIAMEQRMRGFMDEQQEQHRAMIANFQHQAFPLHETAIRLRVSHWTHADGDCGVYALGILFQGSSMPSTSLVEHLSSLRSIESIEATSAAQGISGRNANRWLSYQQLVEIGRLLGLADIAVVTFNLHTNTWANLAGDPSSSTHIIGGVPASLGGPINHWVVLRRE